MPTRLGTTLRSIKAALQGQFPIIGYAEAQRLTGIPQTTFHRLREHTLRVAYGDLEPTDDMVLLPQPVAELQCGPIYFKQEMESFALYYHHLMSQGRPHRRGVKPRPSVPLMSGGIPPPGSAPPLKEASWRRTWHAKRGRRLSRVPEEIIGDIETKKS